jgi:hypothetical protein
MQTARYGVYVSSFAKTMGNQSHTMKSTSWVGKAITRADCLRRNAWSTGLAHDLQEEFCSHLAGWVPLLNVDDTALAASDEKTYALFRYHTLCSDPE